MAAGLGFKTFTTGEVLTAADTNGYLMQGVLVFADAAARDAAITSPQEGQFAFTKDDNSLFYYSGAAWVVSGATGDVTGVTAGTGVTVTDPTGPVPTVTNSMATAIDAKGDLIGGTGADAFDRLAVGTDGQTLVADSAEATGLKWATAASGGETLISTTSMTGASTVLSSIPSTYNSLRLVVTGFTNATADGTFRLNWNGSANFYYSGVNNGTAFSVNDYYLSPNTTSLRTASNNVLAFTFPNYATASAYRAVNMYGFNSSSATLGSLVVGGFANSSTALSSITLTNSGGNWSTGTVYLYGVK